MWGDDRKDHFDEARRMSGHGLGEGWQRGHPGGGQV